MLADVSAAARPADSRRPDRAGIANPLDPRRRLSAVLFDLDGTLYDQRRLRALMAAELLTLPLTNPIGALRSWRGLSAYRRAQETLRTEGWSGSGARAQIEHAAADAGVAASELAPIVEEWMFERPLKYMQACRAAGLVELLTFLGGAGVELGVLSDYPVESKLRALGVSDHFSIVLCSTDPDVGALKPDPRGFLRACERWQLDPADVLVVGDRFDVDAAGATAAGMPCVIISSSRVPTRFRRRPANREHQGVLVVSSLERLHRVFNHVR